MAVIVVPLLALLAHAWFGEHADLRARRAMSLQAVPKVERALTEFLSIATTDARLIAESPTVRKLVSSQPEGDTISAAPTPTVARDAAYIESVFAGLVRSRTHYDDIRIVDLDGRLLAGAAGAPEAVIGSLADLPADVLASRDLATSMVSLSDVYLPTQQTSAPPMIFASAPIRDLTERVVAVVTVGVQATAAFGQLAPLATITDAPLFATTTSAHWVSSPRGAGEDGASDWTQAVEPTVAEQDVGWRAALELPARIGDSGQLAVGSTRAWQLGQRLDAGALRAAVIKRGLRLARVYLPIAALLGLLAYGLMLLDARQRERRVWQMLVSRALEVSDDGLAIVDRSGRALNVNPAFTRLTTPSAVIDAVPCDLLSLQTVQSGDVSDARPFMVAVQACLERDRWSGELIVPTGRGETKAVRMDMTCLVEPAVGTPYVALKLTDVSEEKARHEKLWRMALQDGLTKLPNRDLLNERLERAMARLRRRPEQHVAVLYIDLDGFKPVNDTYGHEAGDAVLSTLAGRLQACVRADDTAARVGGDEFVALLDQVRDADETLAVAKRILESLPQPVHFGDETLRVGCSIGIALAPDHASEATELLRFADKAMYHAKAGGKNTVHMFEPDVDETQTELLSDLRSRA